MSKFTQALKKQAKDHWDSAREKEGGGFRGCTLPDGDYVGLLDIETSVGERDNWTKGCPIIKFIFTVDEGSFEGNNSAVSERVLTDDARGFEFLAKDLKNIFPEDKEFIAEMDVDGLGDFLEDKEEDDDDIRVKFSVVRTTKVTKKKNADGEMEDAKKTYVNFYVNDRVD